MKVNKFILSQIERSQNYNEFTQKLNIKVIRDSCQGEERDIIFIHLLIHRLKKYHILYWEVHLI